MTPTNEARAFTVRRAGPADVDAIATAHRQSIQSIGPSFYSADVVDDWCANIDGRFYLDAMARGVVFFIALGERDGERVVLGFSSHHQAEGEHRTGVYVRGDATRAGVGSALFHEAEAAAVAAGAASIHLDASLAAVDFYQALGFEEIGRGEHRLRSGRPMACVFMRKDLARARASPAP